MAVKKATYTATITMLWTEATVTSGIFCIDQILYAEERAL